MTQLRDIPHSDNWAQVVITRLGLSRKTTYRIQNPLAAYDPQAALVTSDFLRRIYGNTLTEEER